MEEEPRHLQRIRTNQDCLSLHGIVWYKDRVFPVSFLYIKNTILENTDPTNDTSAMPTRPRGLLVELNRPQISMDSSGTGGFHQCGDFTEDQQASQVLVDRLGGHPNTLSGYRLCETKTDGLMLNRTARYFWRGFLRRAYEHTFLLDGEISFSLSGDIWPTIHSYSAR